MSHLSTLPAWQALSSHFRSSTFDLRSLFAADAKRFERYSIAHGALLLDYSKHHVTDETLRLLAALADARDMRGWIGRLICGERINVTENRPALHTALRANRAVV